MNATNTVKLFGIALFAGVLLAAVARQWLGPPVDIHENRELAARPDLPGSLDEWEAFPDTFTAYMNDHFGFRGHLLRGYNRALVALGVSPTGSVILGKEGWLFLEQEELTDQNRGALPLSEEDLGRYLEGFRVMRRGLAERGIPLLLLPVPEKQTLYPGKLPGWIRIAGPGRFDQVTGYLREAGEPFVDVLPALESARARGERVYWQTDSHWTCLGALRGYQLLMDSIESLGLPGARRVSPAELEFTAVDDMRGKDLSRTLLQLPETLREHHGIRCRVPERQALEIVRLTDGTRTDGGFRVFHQSHHVRYRVPGREPRARVLLYRDSFANALLKYLVESVDEVVVVPRPGLQLDLSLVERYQPDLVIFEFAERFLLYQPELVGGD